MQLRKGLETSLPISGSVFDQNTSNLPANKFDFKFSDLDFLVTRRKTANSASLTPLAEGVVIRKTICVRVRGGIGNQLFQYSAALAVARSVSRPVFLESEIPARAPWLPAQIGRRPNKRSFLLPQLGLPIKRVSSSTWVLDPDELGRVTPVRAQLEAMISSQEQGARTILDDSVEWEAVLKNLDQSSGNIVLDGYWQQSKIVESVFPELLAQLRPFLAQGLRREKRSNSQSLMVHVRRGDYVWSGARYSKGLLSFEYFRDAIDLARQNLDFDDVRVFTEDVSWCMKAFSGVASVDVVRPNTRDPQIDLARMASGKGLVISNSTFSWWAALLSSDRSQIVIAPSPWAVTNRNEADYFVRGWTYLQSTFDTSLEV